MEKLFTKKIFLAILIFSFSILIIASDNPIQKESYFSSFLVQDLEYHNRYISNIGLEIYWEFSENDSLYMVLKAPVTGWISIGFDATRRMANAKIIIAGFESEKVILEEHIGTSQISHRKINEKYITNFKGERTSSNSFVEFEIPLKDSRYNIKKGEKINVIIGFHNSSDSFTRRHTQRSTVEVIF